ncbi:MAG: cytochrome c [Acidimicrobiia bacterium]|nr:cytochrome c [Acidimicrobiia bacterium]
MIMMRMRVIAALAAVALLAITSQARERVVEWPCYGGQQAHTKCSRADGGDAMLLAFALPAAGPGGAAIPTAQAPRERAPVTAVAQDQADPVAAGRAAFERVCQACHGAEARGDAGPRLVPFSREYDELLGIVREGVGQMPPISTRELSDENVAQILAYLQSLSRQRPAA